MLDISPPRTERKINLGRVEQRYSESLVLRVQRVFC